MVINHHVRDVHKTGSSVNIYPPGEAAVGNLDMRAHMHAIRMSMSVIDCPGE
jgi:hypothetical protein